VPAGLVDVDGLAGQHDRRSERVPVPEQVAGVLRRVAEAVDDHVGLAGRHPCQVAVVVAVRPGERDPRP
jgi:hypothetical protein